MYTVGQIKRPIQLNDYTNNFLSEQRRNFSHIMHEQKIVEFRLMTSQSSYKRRLFLE